METKNLYYLRYKKVMFSGSDWFVRLSRSLSVNSITQNVMKGL